MTTTLFDIGAHEDMLRAEFSLLSSNLDVVEKAIALLRYWFENPLCEEQRPAVRAHIEQRQFALLLDSFYQFVPFGTGGRRGRVGYGPNRINDVTVALSVQGHCDYLRSFHRTAEERVIVAYDVRLFSDLSGTYRFLGDDHSVIGLSSRDLAHLACEIYAANGFTAFLPSQHKPNTYFSTPELSFTIRYLKASGGVNVSASHNHPDDNGFKFYTAEGAQDVPPYDETMAEYMNRTSSVRRIDFDEGKREGHIREVDPAIHDSYVGLSLALRTRDKALPQPIVYTPLCGTGDSTVGDVLRAAGYNVQVFEPQAQYDGSFSSVPLRLPNPELPASASPALEFADAIGSSIVFSTDPDADRIGLYARTADGTWRSMTGNEIAAILTHYLILDSEFGPQRQGLVIKTVVTTRLMTAVARAANCPIVSDLLVGFKYISNVLSCLDRDGRFGDIVGSSDDLIIAAEESHGVLLTPHIRDKDAAGGALLLAELTTQLLEHGRTLPEYCDAIARAHGNYTNAAASLVMRGIRGTQALNTMMDSLRHDPPRVIGEREVTRFRDYLDAETFGRSIVSETDRIARNLLVFDLPGAEVTIRPSGTEPKVKIYVDLEGRAFGIPSDRQEASRFAQTIAGQMSDLCMERIGIKLSPSAKLLPEFIELDLKRKFDEEFRDQLLNRAEWLAREPLAERQAWLREQLAPFSSGSDPIQVTKDALLQLCDDAANAAGQSRLSDALAEVAKAVRHVGGSQLR